MRLFLLTALTMIAFAANSVLNRMALAGGGIDAMSFGTIRLIAGGGHARGALARPARELPLEPDELLLRRHLLLHYPLVLFRPTRLLELERLQRARHG